MGKAAKTTRELLMGSPLMFVKRRPTPP